MSVLGNREETWTFFEGAWHPGNVRIMGPRTHAAWLGSSVFDGARSFEGVMPDIEHHFRRVNRSAVRLQLEPVVPVDVWIELAQEGVARFPRDVALYIRPMYWAEQNGPLAIAPGPGSAAWCLTVYATPLPNPDGGAITLSPFRRPTIETMPVDAKAGCLYPNNARAILEARARGFDNCVMCDMLGNVAELANSNLFMARDGVVQTPVPNGTFLDGITRQRVIGLLREAGVPVVEGTLRYEDLQSAEEIFSTGNYAKVIPITRIDNRPIQPGRYFRTARELYWAFAHS